MMKWAYQASQKGITMSKAKVTALFLIFHTTILAQNSYYGNNQLRPIYVQTIINNNFIGLPGKILIQEAGSTTDYIISNNAGSTRSILNQENNIEISGDYDPYGHITETIPDHQKEQCHYAGTYNWDNNTKMYASPTRKYDPASGKFTSLDPLNYSYSGYTFVNDNPISFTDRKGLAPTPVRDYDNPAFADLFGHPVFPEQLHLDEDSYNTLKLIKPGNAFAGVMNLKTGDMYLNPLTPMKEMQGWQGTVFSQPARMSGNTVLPIDHFSGHLRSHEQLASRVVAYNTSMNYEDFVGFHIRYAYDEPYLHLGPRSMSQNGEKFRQWINGANHAEQAFETFRNNMTGKFYPKLYKKRIAYYASLPGNTDINAALLAAEELNTEYKAAEGDYLDPEEAAYFQDIYLWEIKGRKVTLKPVQAVPNYDDVIVPVRESQLPQPFADKIFDYFNGLRDLPAPMKLIMKEFGSY